MRSSRLTTPGQLWLYRTKPLEDELLSSWLVRLASGNAVKLQSFCVHVLRRRANFWIDDVDRAPCMEMLHILSDGTAVNIERAMQTGLNAYEGALWANYQAGGLLAWVMPLTKKGRRRESHGQQFCRQCLATDEQPYFRRRWRLAFNIVCEVHATFLEDACPHCSRPVEFHAGDFGARLLDFDCPIARCGSCRCDFRSKLDSSDRPAPLALVLFQKSLNALLTMGYCNDLPIRLAYPHLFFEGCRYLVQLLASRGRRQRLRNLMWQGIGQLPLDVSSKRTGPLFEELRLGDRAMILESAAMLLTQWPTEFIRLCQESRLSSSYIMAYKGQVLPYWLWQEVWWHLYDKDYSPTVEERNSVVRLLRKHGHAVNRNTINYWLGVASVGTGPFKHRRNRWNPRGPRER